MNARRSAAAALLVGAAALGVWWVSMVTQQTVVSDPVSGAAYGCGSAYDVAWISNGTDRGGERRADQGVLDRACTTEAEELLEFTWVPALPAAAAVVGAGVLLWPQRLRHDPAPVDRTLRFSPS